MPGGSTISDNGSLPNTDFTFGDVIGNLWTNVQPIAQNYLNTWGQVQVAKANAEAQANLNALKAQNATLGSNQPAAAQREADKTLAQKWLPPFMAESGKALLPWILIGAGVLVAVLVVKRLLK